MKEIKPLFFRRLLAWILDTILIGGLIAGYFFMTMPRESLESVSGLTGWLQKNPALSDKLSLLQQWEKIQASLKELPEADARKVAQQIDRVVKDLFEKNYGDLLKNPTGNMDRFFKLPELDLNTLSRNLMDQLKEQNLSAESLTKIQDLDKRLQEAISGLKPDLLAKDFFTILTTVLFVPLWIILGYFALEALFGASLGKIVFRIQVGTSDGSRANVIMFVPRYLIKEMPAILLLVCVYTLEGWWALGSGIMSLVIFFSCFGLLGAKRQALYDKMTGTSVFASKAFKNPNSPKA